MFIPPTSAHPYPSSFFGVDSPPIEEPTPTVVDITRSIPVDNNNSVSHEISFDPDSEDYPTDSSTPTNQAMDMVQSPLNSIAPFYLNPIDNAININPGSVTQKRKRNVTNETSQTTKKKQKAKSKGSKEKKVTKTTASSLPKPPSETVIDPQYYNSTLKQYIDIVNSTTRSLLELNRIVFAQSTKVDNQNTIIQQQTTKLENQDTKIQEQTTKIENQDTKIQELTTKLDNQDTKLEELTQKVNNQSVILNILTVLFSLPSLPIHPMQVQNTQMPQMSHPLSHFNFMSQMPTNLPPSLLQFLNFPKSTPLNVTQPLFNQSLQGRSTLAPFPTPTVNTSILERPSQMLNQPRTASTSAAHNILRTT